MYVPSTFNAFWIGTQALQIASLLIKDNFFSSGTHVFESSFYLSPLEGGQFCLTKRANISRMFFHFNIHSYSLARDTRVRNPRDQQKNQEVETLSSRPKTVLRFYIERNFTIYRGQKCLYTSS